MITIISQQWWTNGSYLPAERSLTSAARPLAVLMFSDSFRMRYLPLHTHTHTLPTPLLWGPVTDCCEKSEEINKDNVWETTFILYVCILCTLPANYNFETEHYALSLECTKLMISRGIMFRSSRIAHR